MFCILREDINEIISYKVLDKSFLELSEDGLCEKGLFTALLSVLALDSMLEADLFQFSNSKFGIEFFEDLKRGEAKKEQLCLLSSCVIRGINKTMDSNLIMSENEKNLYEALLNDYEKNGFDFPFFKFCLNWMVRGIK